MKKASNATLPWSVGGEHDLRDRHEDLGELGVLHVLQHHALGALLLQHALVVRQVEGRGLHAAVGVARGEHDVDDGQRRKAGELRVAILRIDRQHVLDALQLAAEPGQLVRLDVVAKGDERLERRLVVEELVLVDLVRSDRRLDRALELHPRDVAVVVVVGQKRLRALREKRLQASARPTGRRPHAAVRPRAPARSDTRGCTGRGVN